MLPSRIQPGLLRPSRDHRKPTDRPRPNSGGTGGFLCLSSFPVALSPLTTYTIIVRSSSSCLTFIPSSSLPVFCFWEAAEAIVERVGALESLRLGPYHFYLLSDLG